MNVHGVGPTAERLQSVADLEQLHSVLQDLAVTEGSRWTRSQVSYFLPKQWRRASEQYFTGERLVGRDAIPFAPEPLSAPSLQSAMQAARARLTSDDTEQATGIDVESSGLLQLSQLLALPEPQGNGALANIFRALRSEMRQVHSRSPTRYRLVNGRCISSSRGQFAYKFDWSSEPDPFCPGTLKFDKVSVSARVGDPDPERTRTFELLVEEYLGPSVKAAVFYVDPTFLLRVVHEKLRIRDDGSDVPEQATMRLCSPPNAVASNVLRAPINAKDMNTEQMRGLMVGLSTARSFVWGPPGTGKTRTVGAMVGALAKTGKRVLVLSPYNVAVDQAMIAVAKSSPEATDSMVRIGRSGADVRQLGIDMESRLEAEALRTGALQIARDLVASTMARAVGDRVVPPSTMRACLDEIGAWIARSGRGRSDPVVAELTEILSKLRSAFRRPEDAILRDAQIVGCTMALSFLLEKIYDSSFDQIIVDEASVVRTPEAVLTAVLCAGAPICFFGDPKQLPAIVIENSRLTDEWFGRSPFALAGISEPSDASGSCVMLAEQHRMAPPIRTLVSEMFYSGTLRDGVHAPKQGQIVVVDTSQTGARSTPRMIKLSNSKENLLHRHIVADIVRAVTSDTPDANILVLSPFSAQRRAYRKEPATARLTRSIRFETIHTSQGSEQDVVIIDFVLAGSGVGTRSRMLDDRSNRHLSKLLNVGISRARMKLILVADLQLIQTHYPEGLVHRLIDSAVRQGQLFVAPADLHVRRAFEAALKIDHAY